MSVCLVVLAVLLGCPVSAPDPAQDPWLAEDKLRHFTLSGAATTLGYGGARLGLERDAALAAAGGVALGLGLAKEALDRRAGGRFSFKDLAWDAAGVALGLTLAHNIR